MVSWVVTTSRRTLLCVFVLLLSSLASSLSAAADVRRPTAGQVDPGQAAGRALAEALRASLGADVKRALDQAKAVDLLRVREDFEPVGHPADVQLVDK